MPVGMESMACGTDFGSLNLAVYRSFLFASRLVAGRFWIVGLSAKWLPNK